MQDFILERQYAETKDLTKDKDIEGKTFGCLRLYRSSPDYFTLQIRSIGKITNSGKPRRMVSHVNLTWEQLTSMLAYAEQARE
jgi:hypothetical protein